MPVTLPESAVTFTGIREARELEPDARLLLRQQRSRLVADALHAWLTTQRQTLA